MSRALKQETAVWNDGRENRINTLIFTEMKCHKIEIKLALNVKFKFEKKKKKKCLITQFSEVLNHPKGH